MKKLFLDELRLPPDASWDIVRSYEDFVAYVESHGTPDVLTSITTSAMGFLPEWTLRNGW